MSLVWHIRLTDQAEQNFLDITLWTAENFGTQQSEHYAETIGLAIEALYDGPEILEAKVRDEIGVGIRTLPVTRPGRKGRHFVAFSVSEGHIINVLRVLHNSMDLAKHRSEEHNKPH